MANHDALVSVLRIAAANARKHGNEQRARDIEHEIQQHVEKSDQVLFVPAQSKPE